MKNCPTPKIELSLAVLTSKSEESVRGTLLTKKLLFFTLPPFSRLILNFRHKIEKNFFKNSLIKKN
jgi:hypothetical protein